MSRLAAPARKISIHIPRVGDDPEAVWTDNVGKLFQSTSPVWGMTADEDEKGNVDYTFQSTSPVWGMTIPAEVFDVTQVFQSTSPVWGMTHPSSNHNKGSIYFNPHPPCGG